MKRKLYEAIASAIQARANCERTDNTEWFHRHTETVEQLVDTHMPSGSGVDNGTKLDFTKSTGSKLIFDTSYHHMNDAGYYDGWTDHTVTVVPSFIGGFDLKVTGRDKRDIKDYLADLFAECLSVEVGND